MVRSGSRAAPRSTSGSQIGDGAKPRLRAHAGGPGDVGEELRGHAAFANERLPSLGHGEGRSIRVKCSIRCVERELPAVRQPLEIHAAARDRSAGDGHRARPAGSPRGPRTNARGADHQGQSLAPGPSLHPKMRRTVLRVYRVEWSSLADARGKPALGDRRCGVEPGGGCRRLNRALCGDYTVIQPAIDLILNRLKIPEWRPLAGPPSPPGATPRRAIR
jgi:hypothetical protein